MSIRSFADAAVEDYFFDGTLPRKGCGWKRVSKVVARKLDMLDAAVDVQDLRSPPSNHLKQYTGGPWAGFHSIRINDQWRLIFHWSDEGPTEVQIVDYH